MICGRVKASDNFTEVSTYSWMMERGKKKQNSNSPKIVSTQLVDGGGEGGRGVAITKYQFKEAREAFSC